MLNPAFDYSEKFSVDCDGPRCGAQRWLETLETVCRVKATTTPEMRDWRLINATISERTQADRISLNLPINESDL